MRFSLLRPLADDSVAPTTLRQPWQRAAVLIPLIMRTEGLHVLLTLRSPHLRHHPGQISFPGGRHDAQDHSLAATALRETHEELGIPPHAVHLLGQLPPHRTHSGFMVTPYLGLLTSPLDLQPAPDEVAAAFSVPLAPLLETKAYGQWPVTRSGQRQTVYGMVLSGHLIWGATARMLWQLATQIAD